MALNFVQFSRCASLFMANQFRVCARYRMKHTYRHYYKNAPPLCPVTSPRLILRGSKCASLHKFSCGFRRDIQQMSTSTTIQKPYKMRTRVKNVGRKSRSCTELPSLATKSQKNNFFLSQVKSCINCTRTTSGKPKINRSPPRPVSLPATYLHSDFKLHTSRKPNKDKIYGGHINRNKLSEVAERVKMCYKPRINSRQCETKKIKRNQYFNEKGVKCSKHNESIKSCLYAKAKTPSRRSQSVDEMKIRNTTLNEEFIISLSNVTKEMIQWLKLVNKYLAKLEQTQHSHKIEDYKKKREISKSNVPLKKQAKKVTISRSSPCLTKKQHTIKTGKDTHFNVGKPANIRSFMNKEPQKSNQKISRPVNEINSAKWSGKHPPSKTSEPSKESQELLEICPKYIKNIRQNLNNGTQKVTDLTKPMTNQPNMTSAHTMSRKNCQHVINDSRKETGFILVDSKSSKLTRSSSESNIENIIRCNENGFILIDAQDSGRKSTTTDHACPDEKGFIMINNTIDSDNSIRRSKQEPKNFVLVNDSPLSSLRNSRRNLGESKPNSGSNSKANLYESKSNIESNSKTNFSECKPIIGSNSSTNLNENKLNFGSNRQPIMKVAQTMSMKSSQSVNNDSQKETDFIIGDSKNPKLSRARSESKMENTIPCNENGFILIDAQDSGGESTTTYHACPDEKGFIMINNTIDSDNSIRRSKQEPKNFVLVNESPLNHLRNSRRNLAESTPNIGSSSTANLGGSKPNVGSNFRAYIDEIKPTMGLNSRTNLNENKPITGSNDKDYIHSVSKKGLNADFVINEVLNHTGLHRKRSKSTSRTITNQNQSQLIGASDSTEEIRHPRKKPDTIEGNSSLLDRTHERPALKDDFLSNSRGLENWSRMIEKTLEDLRLKVRSKASSGDSKNPNYTDKNRDKRVNALKGTRQCLQENGVDAKSSGTFSDRFQNVIKARWKHNLESILENNAKLKNAKSMISCVNPRLREQPKSATKKAPVKPFETRKVSRTVSPNIINKGQPNKININSPNKINMSSPNKVKICSSKKVNVGSPNSVNTRSLNKINIHSPNKFKIESFNKVNRRSSNKISMSSPNKINTGSPNTDKIGIANKFNTNESRWDDFNGVNLKQTKSKPVEFAESEPNLPSMKQNAGVEKCNVEPHLFNKPGEMSNKSKQLSKLSNKTDSPEAKINTQVASSDIINGNVESVSWLKTGSVRSPPAIKEKQDPWLKLLQENNKNQYGKIKNNDIKSAKKQKCVSEYVKTEGSHALQRNISLPDLFLQMQLSKDKAPPLSNKNASNSKKGNRINAYNNLQKSASDVNMTKIKTGHAKRNKELIRELQNQWSQDFQEKNRKLQENSLCSPHVQRNANCLVGTSNESKTLPDKVSRNVGNVPRYGDTTAQTSSLPFNSRRFPKIENLPTMGMAERLLSASKTTADINETSKVPEIKPSNSSVTTYTDATLGTSDVDVFPEVDQFEEWIQTNMPEIYNDNSQTSINKGKKVDPPSKNLPPDSWKLSGNDTFGDRDVYEGSCVDGLCYSSMPNRQPKPISFVEPTAEDTLFYNVSYGDKLNNEQYIHKCAQDSSETVSETYTGDSPNSIKSPTGIAKKRQGSLKRQQSPLANVSQATNDVDSITRTPHKNELHPKLNIPNIQNIASRFDPATEKNSHLSGSLDGFVSMTVVESPISPAKTLKSKLKNSTSRKSIEDRKIMLMPKSSQDANIANEVGNVDKIYKRFNDSSVDYQILEGRYDEDMTSADNDPRRQLSDQRKQAENEARLKMINEHSIKIREYEAVLSKYKDIVERVRGDLKVDMNNPGAQTQYTSEV